VTLAEETPTELHVRTEVREWLARNWDPDVTLAEWWIRLADSGWGYPTWPREWFGRGLPAELATAVRDEIRAAGALPPPHGIGQTMGAPVILQFGTEEQKRRWMRPLATGEEGWVQFFSEPNAGSDLASLQTKAVRDGDEWVVNGQKVWNSGTVTAERALLVARTNSDVPKHKGLSFFVIDVQQPGIEVRPIRQLNGQAEFNETAGSTTAGRSPWRRWPTSGAAMPRAPTTAWGRRRDGAPACSTSRCGRRSSSRSAIGGRRASRWARHRR
jgi:alkylation response protein AidB-like acyl-CoA dehydrogenase